MDNNKKKLLDALGIEDKNADDEYIIKFVNGIKNDAEKWRTTQKIIAEIVSAWWNEGGIVSPLLNKTCEANLVALAFNIYYDKFDLTEGFKQIKALDIKNT